MAALAFCTVRCGGSPTVTCQTQTCGNDATKSYRACAHTNGDLSYDFGGQSCACPTSDATTCQSCATQVAAYCEGAGGSGGSGGTGGGGAGGGPTTCRTTFSGAFSAAYAPCAVTITSVPAGGLWSVATAGNAIPGTSYTWSGMSFALSGTPSAGTFDQTQSVGASDIVQEPDSADPPEWLAGNGSGMTYGSASLTITSLGPSTDVNGSTLYQAPHGTWTGTLVDQNPNTSQPPLMQTISF